MFNRVEIQQLVASLAVVKRLGYHHFRIQQSPSGDLPHQHPEVPIGAVEHRCDAEAERTRDLRCGDGVHGSMLPAGDGALRLETILFTG